MDQQLQFKDPNALTSPKLTALLNIWIEIAGERTAPSRSDVTPARIRGLLGSTWMIDVIGTGEDFRFRFAGDRIIQFMGQRYAGSLLSQQRGEPFFDDMHALVSACVATKKPLAIGPIRSTFQTRDYLEIEVLVLPLSDDGSQIDCVCGGFETWPLGTHLPKGK